MEIYHQDCVPTNVSALAFAVSPSNANYFDHRDRIYLHSQTEAQPSVASHSSPFPHYRAEKPIIKHGNSTHSQDSQPHQPATLSQIKARHSVITSLRRTQTQALLLRCQLLDCTIQSTSSKPWAQHGPDPTYGHYEDMRSLAFKARQLAESTQTPALQARCEYWAGRACAGTRDYRAAAEHLRRARWLDVRGGLRRGEKRDVEVVLRGVEACIADEAVGGEWDPARGAYGAGLRVSAAREWTARERWYVLRGRKECPDSPRVRNFRTLDQEFRVGGVGMDDGGVV